jgi:hypothetical protein
MLHRKKIYNLLFEKEDKDIDSPEKAVHLKNAELKARKSLYSIDNQIDALILRYESSSIIDEDLNEYSLNNQSLKYLFEQEEEADPLADVEEEEDAEAEEETKSTATEPSGNEKQSTKQPAEEIKVPNLDIDAFTSRTVRLISNPENLLKLKIVVINRVKNFLDEHYGDEYVVRYLDTLRNEYGIEVSEFDESTMEETNDDIFAPGANPAATGGGG